MKKQKNIFAIDPGTITSGISIIEDQKILTGKILDNESVFGYATSWANQVNEGIIVVEDITAYSVRLGQSTIDTIKFIGELSYRLRVASVGNILIPRWKVKQWAFNSFPKIVTPRVEQKILKSERKKIDGELPKPHMAYVDDRIMIAVMKEYWKIPTPKPGKSNVFGLSSHSWQALAVATTYLHLED